MRILVGLGNPGAKYQGNRHNIGFMALDEIARRHGFSPWRRRFQGETADGLIGGERVTLLKPLTFMNGIRRAVQDAASFFKLGLPDIIVLHDEIELPAAKLRVKVGGGIAGHNGLRLISAHVGNEYRRVRIGVGHPGVKELVDGHVLNDFAKAERPWVEAMLEAITDNAELLVGDRDLQFQDKVHLALQAKGFLERATTATSKTAPSNQAPEPQAVIAGLVPAIQPCRGKTGCAASRPGMTVFLVGREGHRKSIMGFKCGIVGLPNVGKSTLFNALTETAAAQAANYPFCTIEPNVGEVAVPDPRLDTLAAPASRRRSSRRG